MSAKQAGFFIGAPFLTLNIKLFTLRSDNKHLLLAKFIHDTLSDDSERHERIVIPSALLFKKKTETKVICLVMTDARPHNTSW